MQGIISDVKAKRAKKTKKGREVEAQVEHDVAVPKLGKVSKGKKLKEESAGNAEAEKVEESESSKVVRSKSKASTIEESTEVVEDVAPKAKKAKASKTPTLKDDGIKTKKTKASKPGKILSSKGEAEQSVGEAEDTGHAEEEDVQFFGFATDEDDSSDEEMDAEPDALDVSKLPTIAKDDATVKRKLEKAKRKPTEDRGVIYLGRIPHGFYEVQMKSYFSQFGDVSRLRLSRNKTTGRSKHYAFLEFESSSVAQIVAETMDNYLLMGHILTCKVIPKDEVHAELWVGANRKWRPVPMSRVARVQHNKPRTEEEQEKAEKRLIKRQTQKKRKLAESEINYDFEAVAYKKKA
ncbi:hypothetical protein EW026_g2264 [Hermanssonia centrifuga]|uniref:RRM domain-containing protein n=1 Tax=Hermanssonia centrifuga TaxID=98765 RepID=A0A4V3XB13_9APHY|nr:hypothetical protein EW026_g2264 [Hermanssonia centrifuga]